MSQDELASKLGYKSRSTIAKIESGENDITQSKIVEFAKALETTPAYLMGWDDIEPETIAAHKNNPDEDWTQEELDEIEAFKEFVRMKRKSGK
jgi:transcriptional regulator with XRE-family HTH domain